MCAGTKLGLPELQLGILPGFGGTQRLPRRGGLQTAAQMMMTRETINDKKAAKLGLVDAVVPKEKLLEAARAWAAEIAAGSKPRNFSLYRSPALLLERALCMSVHQDALEALLAC